MKITKTQLKQIIKEELGDWTPEMQRRARHSPMIAALSATDRGTRASRERAAQAAEGGLYDIYPKSPQTDYRTEFEIIADDLKKIQMMTTPDALKTGERIDVVLDQEDMEEIHTMATDAHNKISEYITQMMREEDPEPDRYEREERAIRRAGPKGPMSPEEHAKYMSLYGDEPV
jgi:hypothetical protein